MRLLMWSAVRDELIVEGSPMESLHNRDSRLGLVFVLWGVGSLIWLEKIFSRGENLSDLLLSSQDAHHNTLLVFNIWCAMRNAHRAYMLMLMWEKMQFPYKHFTWACKVYHETKTIIIHRKYFFWELDLLSFSVSSKPMWLTWVWKDLKGPIFLKPLDI